MSFSSQTGSLIALILAGLATHSFAAKQRDIVYATIGDRELELDLHLPSEKKSETLLIYIHGGAWRGGSKSDVKIKGMLDLGYAIASVQYRLTPEAKFPANVHDIKAAIRFLRAKQKDFGVGAERIVILGSSAGGHLAALVGVINGHKGLEGKVGDYLDQSSAVQGAVSFYGASNLETILKQSTPHGLSVRVPALELLLGDVPEKVPDIARLASPVVHVDRSDPPMLLIHGDQDPQMPVNQSLELQAVYEEHGRTVKFINVHGGAHGGPQFYDGKMMKTVDEFIRESVD